MRSCCTLSQHVRVNLRFLEDVNYQLPTLDKLFRQIKMFIKVRVAFFLGSRPFNRYILLKSINQRVWSPKSKATQTFMNVAI